jgi:L-alanine-DL-glutamate epimerase-like enolase superfamily enzyme
LTLTNAGLGDDVTSHPIRIRNGCTDVLDHPGLGIDVDENRVLRHRVQIATRHAVP